MSREDRRAAIVRATVPLLRIHGQDVTTRQIAEASGIGEGTIFRVFADKAELLDECVAAVFDATPTLAQLSAIDPSLPLEPRLLAAVRILQARLRSVVEVLIALRFVAPPEDPRRHRMDPRAAYAHDEILLLLEQLLEPDRHRLRTSPAEFARVARSLTFAASHPKINDDQPMSAEQVVDVLLHGMLNREEPPGC